MGRIHVDHLDGGYVYACVKCGTHLTRVDDLISKAFRGRTGKAFLFDSVVNYVPGPAENRLLITGLHTIADVYCGKCQHNIGWMYLEAFEETQKYKVGKYILEKAHITKVNDTAS